MRLFVGIPLARLLAKEIATLVETLRTPTDGLRWTSPASWHITLQFLGEVPAAQCSAVQSALQGIQAEVVPVQLEGLSDWDRSGLLLLTVCRTPELLSLQKRVEEATGSCGFRPEERVWRPHITLARSKDRRALLAASQAARQCPSSAFVAKEFFLYESFLSPAGSRYELRGRYPLQDLRISGE